MDIFTHSLYFCSLLISVKLDPSPFIDYREKQLKSGKANIVLRERLKLEGEGLSSILKVLRLLY